MAEKHYHEQKEFTKIYLLNYFKKYIDNFNNLKILEIGCAEGGLIEILNENGNNVVGLEIDDTRIQIAHKKNPYLKIIQGDITDPNIPSKILSELNLMEDFDFIIMREVIEHLHDKDTAFRNLDFLLKKGGYLFISFPPKYSPFAGHQQIGKSLLKIIPYLHLVPNCFLIPVAKLLGEQENYVKEIKYHYSTGCTINQFENLSLKYGFKFIRKDLYLFRPIYSIRFGLPTIKILDIPLIREFISFGYEVLLRKDK